MRWDHAIRSAAAFDLPLIGFLVSVAVTARYAIETSSARSALAWIAASVLAAIVLGWLGRSRAAWRLTAVAVVTAGGLAAVHAITHYRFLDVEGKVASLDALGRLVSAPFPRGLPWFPFSNTVATLLEGVLPLSIGVSLDERFRPWRWVMRSAAVLLAVALLLMVSRGAWIALLAGAVIWIAAEVSGPVWRRAVPIVASAAIGAIGLAMTTVDGVALVSQVSTAAGGILVRPDRLAIYRDSVSLLTDIGLLGLGPGEQYALPFSWFALVIQVPFVTYPHHLWLHLSIAFGVAGVVAWTWYAGSVIAAAAIAEHSAPSPAFRGAWVGLCVIWIHGLMDARQAVDPWTWAPLFLLSALVVARARRVAVQPGWLTLIAPAVVALAVGAVELARYQPMEAALAVARGHQREARCRTGLVQSPQAMTLCDDAMRLYQEAIASDPTQAAAHRRLALRAIDEGQFAEGDAHARAAYASDPDGLASRKIAGLAATWAGDRERAEALLVGVPGAAAELETWSEAWRRRDQPGASREATAMAARLRGAVTPHP